MQDIDDDLLRLANELKINGFKELLLEKQRANTNLHNEVIENMICTDVEPNAEIIIPTYERLPNKSITSTEEASDLCSSIPSINFNAETEPKNTEIVLSLNEEHFISSSKYKHWMKRLASKLIIQVEIENFNDLKMVI